MKIGNEYKLETVIKTVKGIVFEPNTIFSIVGLSDNENGSQDVVLVKSSDPTSLDSALVLDSSDVEDFFRLVKE